MLRFAATGVTSFSEAPLRLALNLGFLVSFVSFVVGMFAVVAKITGIFTVPGWASIVVAVTLIGGVQLIVLGVIGVYIGDIHTEVKRRPLYIVSDLENFDELPDAPPRGIIAGRRTRSRIRA
jgi:dolichol-phosphate mannosyltransferase